MRFPITPSLPLFPAHTLVFLSAQVRSITPQGLTSAVAGTGNLLPQDGVIATAPLPGIGFNSPQSLSVRAVAGTSLPDVLVADSVG